MNGTGTRVSVPFGVFDEPMNEIDGDYIRTGSEWEELLWIWRNTDAPKGCKVEIVKGTISVTPLQTCRHQLIVSELNRALYSVIPQDWRVFQRLGMSVPSRLELYVPDVAVVPQAAEGTGDDAFLPAAAAVLVGEVTSGATADNDRTSKAAGYAEAGVPFYLLVDGVAPGGPEVTLYGEPRGGGYRVLTAAKFGEPIELPEPFKLTLDTSEFPVPMS